MLTITPALKDHMQKNFSVAVDATEEVIRKAVSEAVMNGKIEPTKLAELTKAVAGSEAEAKVQAMIDKSLTAAMSPVLEAIKALKPDAAGTAAGGTPGETKAVNLNTPAGEQGGQSSDAQKMFGAAGAASGGGAGGYPDEATRIRVKGAIEQYSDTRTAATWDKSSIPRVAKALGGMPITAHMENMPYSIDMPTDRSKAIAGVWFKHMGIKRLRAKGHAIAPHLALKDYEKDILQHIVHECKFVGGEDQFGGYEYEGMKLMSDLHRKAVLDDSTSGGLEAVPIEFDAAVILTPLLNGELFPFVSITNVSRRRIEATKISNPTMSWGTSEGTAISLFNTDSFISAFDNNIHPITGAIELGLDFLADSPLAVANIVIDRYGVRFRQEMDNVIADGNGTNQPEGWFTTSGVATVTPAGGAGVAQTVGDYESLRFGVAKEFRQEAGNRAMYIATDTSYSRARGIAVDSSNDQRRVFGIDNQEDYMLFGRRYAISGSLTNAQIGYFCMNRYRMYRRQGLEVRLVTEDWTLARQNKEGLVVRARFGGAPELAAAGAKITAGQV